MTNQRILIAFFSRSGANYAGGAIQNLSVGNTEVAAGKIREIVGGDVFKIESQKLYPEDYYQTTDAAKVELRNNERPKLTGQVNNMSEYDTVILGYPNWWGTMPMPVFTFLEKHDLFGKTIIPFCTHEGSGMGQSESDIRKLCPDSRVLNGLAIFGSRVAKSEKEISNWLFNSGII